MFDINQRVNEIVSTYEGYIPAQFLDKPKARETIRFIIKVALASAIMDQLAECFSMEEASGKVLDMIAQNFGLTRNLPTPNYSTPFFQLPEYQYATQYSTLDVVSLTNNGASPLSLIGIDGADDVPVGCFTVKDADDNEYCLENSLTIAAGATESLVVFRAKEKGSFEVEAWDVLTQVTVESDLATPITVNSQLSKGEVYVGFTDYSTTTNYDSVFRRYSSSDSQNISTPDDILKQVIIFKVLASRCKGSLESIIDLLKSTGLDNAVSITDGMNRTIVYRVSTTNSILASIIFSLNLFPRPIGIESSLVVVSNPLGIFHFLQYGGSALGFCFNAYGHPLNGRGWLKYGDVQFNP